MKRKKKRNGKKPSLSVLFSFSKAAASAYQELTITLKTLRMHRVLERESLKITVFPWLHHHPQKISLQAVQNFQVTHNLKRNLKQRTKKKASAVSLKLKLASKKNFSKIQGKHYFVNYSSHGIFPPRSSGPKGHPCKLLQSRLQKVSWQAGYRLR